MYLTGLFGTFPWCLLHNYDVQALCTLNRIALAPAGKLYRIGLLFKHINGFPGPVSVMEPSCALRSWTCVDTFRIGVCATLRCSLNKCSLADKAYTAKHWAGAYFLSRWRTLDQTYEIFGARVKMGTSVRFAHFAPWKKSILIIGCKKKAWLFCSLNEALLCSNSVRTYE